MKNDVSKIYWQCPDKIKLSREKLACFAIGDKIDFRQFLLEEGEGGETGEIGFDTLMYAEGEEITWEEAVEKITKHLDYSIVVSKLRATLQVEHHYSDEIPTRYFKIIDGVFEYGYSDYPLPEANGMADRHELKVSYTDVFLLDQNSQKVLDCSNLKVSYEFGDELDLSIMINSLKLEFCQSEIEYVCAHVVKQTTSVFDDMLAIFVELEGEKLLFDL